MLIWSNLDVLDLLRWTKRPVSRPHERVNMIFSTIKMIFNSTKVKDFESVRV